MATGDSEAGELDTFRFLRQEPGERARRLVALVLLRQPLAQGLGSRSESGFEVGDRDLRLTTVGSD